LTNKLNAATDQITKIQSQLNELNTVTGNYNTLINSLLRATLSKGNKSNIVNTYTIYNNDNVLYYINIYYGTYNNILGLQVSPSLAPTINDYLTTNNFMSYNLQLWPTSGYPITIGFAKKNNGVRIYYDDKNHDYTYKLSQYISPNVSLNNRVSSVSTSGEKGEKTDYIIKLSVPSNIIKTSYTISLYSDKNNEIIGLQVPSILLFDSAIYDYKVIFNGDLVKIDINQNKGKRIIIDISKTSNEVTYDALLEYSTTGELVKK
jgi:hypothetical protein